MRRTTIALLVAMLVLAVGEGADVTYQQWDWNMKGDVLVIATGSLRYHGPHPFLPEVNDPAGCKSVCSDIAGCNGWTFCNIKSGCGAGCKDYLSQNPALQGEDPSITGRQALPLNTPLADLKRPGAYEGLCSYSDNNKWNFGTCTLKVVANPQSPDFWTQDPAEGWVSGTITTPPACGRDIPARTCAKCQKLAAPKPAQCIACAKKVAVLGTPLPVMRTLIDNAPITTDGCAECYGLPTAGAASSCVSCLTANKKCAQCALQRAQPRAEFVNQFPPTFDAGLCFSCALANGDKSVDACLECAQVKLAANKPKCVSCVAGQKTRFCSYGQPGGGCIPRETCRTCAESLKNMTDCTTCIAKVPWNPDCLACAYNADPARQKTCYACANKVKIYNSNGVGACSDCMSLSPALKVQDCINNCALNANLPATVPRYWCSTCGTQKADQAGWNKCFACLATTDPNNLQVCTK